MSDFSQQAPVSPPPVRLSQDPETLRAIGRRTIGILAVLVPAIVLTVVLVISEHRSQRESDFADRAIPATFLTPGATWTSSRLDFSEEEMQILETRDYVYRTYTDGRPGSSPVEMCIVFSEDNRKGTHPPDVCLEASGFRIISRQDRDMTVAGEPLSIREVVTTSNIPNRYLYFAYFYKCGETFTTSFYRQQVQIVWNGLTHRNAAGALIRFSTPMVNYTDVDEARGRVDELIALSFPSIRSNLR